MTVIATRYDVRPIDPEVLAGLRSSDDAGRAPRLVTDQAGGSPLRCCLRPSHPGEVLALVSYAPLRRWARQHDVDPGAYDEVGPVFIHPQECSGASGDGLPADLLRSTRVFRCYNRLGAIAGGRVVTPDDDPERVLDELFGEADVVLVHARAVDFGCFTFEVRPVRDDRRP